MPLLRLHGHLQEFSISLKCADGQALDMLHGTAAIADQVIGLDAERRPLS